MYTLPTLTLNAGASETLSAGGRGTVGAVAIYNESPNLVRVTWAGSSHWLAAWTADLFEMSLDPGFTGSFALTASNISSASNAPSTVIACVVYAPGERINGTYPVALVRQANVGNNTLPTTASQSVVNDGNTAGTTVVEATQSGQASSSLNLENDGTTLIAPISNGALLDALVITPGDASNPATGSFGDAANPANWTLHGVADQASALAAGATVPAADITGSLPFAQVSAGSAASPAGGSVFALTAPSGTNAELDLTSGAGTVQLQADAGNNFYVIGAAGNIRFGVGTGFGTAFCNGVKLVNGQFCNGFGTFAGSASGTYSHNCGVTPDTVQVTCNKVNSSQTMGVDSAGSSTVHVTCGASFPFYGLAMAHL